MEVLMFFVEALIIFVLALLLGGTLIGYYFQKKVEFETKRAMAFGKGLLKARTDEKTD